MKMDDQNSLRERGALLLAHNRELAELAGMEWTV